jgi:hypothetical protein
VRVVERIAEHYDVQEVEFGRVYRWCPERVVAECDCGERVSLKRADLIGSKVTACDECGADLAAGIREESAPRLPNRDYEAAHHPWRYWHSSADTGIPY